MLVLIRQASLFCCLMPKKIVKLWNFGRYLSFNSLSDENGYSSKPVERCRWMNLSVQISNKPKSAALNFEIYENKIIMSGLNHLK